MMTHSERMSLPYLFCSRCIRRALQLLCIALPLFWGAAASAQLENTGVVSGNIYDAEGAVVPNATVTLTSNERGQTTTQVANAKGEYLFTAVAVGTYTIKITALSFASVVGNNIIVDSDKNVRFDGKLNPASVEATVTVEASSNTVDTRSATIGVLLDNTLVQNLPIDGNNVVALAALLPGVSNVSAPTTFTGDTNGPVYNVSGSRSTQNLFLLDGAVWNNLYTNSGLNFPPPAALQEVSILLNNFKAQYGRNVGSVFNAITKSGTNQIHGVVYEYLQNTALNAYDYFSIPGVRKPQFISNQYGATMGGPIKRDKLFFFLSYQGLRVAQTAINGNSTGGISLANRGEDASGQLDLPCSSTGYFVGHDCFNLSDLAGPTDYTTTGSAKTLNNFVHNPLSPANTQSTPQVAITAFNAAYTQAGHTLLAGVNSPCVNLLQAALVQNATFVANNELPDECLNPVSKAIVDKYVPPATMGITTTYAQLPQRDEIGLVRIDYNVGHGHTVDARYYQTAVSDAITRGNANSVVSYELDADKGNTHFGDIGDTWVIRPNMLNVLRLAYKRYYYFYTPTDHTTLADLGANFANYNSVSVLPSYPDLGAASQAVSSTVNEDIEANDNFTWTKGNHNFQVGVDYLRLQYENVSESAPAFSFGENYSEVFQGDEMLGLPSQAIFANSLNRSGIQHDYYFYAQDDWRITPKLTLDLGLRYELPLRYYQPKNQNTTFIPGYQSIIYPNAVPDLAFVGDPGIRRALIKNEYTDFAPRFGFAYDAFGNGRTSIRGGFGMFYDATNALTIGVGEPFHYIANYNYPSGGVSQPLLGQNPIPPNFNGTNPQFATPFSIFFPDANYRGSYTEAANFGFQQSISSRGMLELNYVLRLGRHQALPLDQNPSIYDCTGSYYQINPTLYCPTNTQAATQTASYIARSRYPGYNYGGSGVVDYNSIGTSNYNGLQVLYRQQATHGLTVTASFSYAKSMDEFSSGTTTASTTPQIDNLKSQYGPSDYDVKLTTGVGWVFAATKMTEGPRPLQVLLSGWTQSGIFNAQTGKPFSVTLTTDCAFTDEAGSSQRAQLAPGMTGTLPSNRHRVDKVNAWFNNIAPPAGCGSQNNNAAWLYPTPGTFSNQSRNDLRGPAFILTTLSAGRVFPLPLTQTTRLEFRADAINFFNTPNLANPNSSFPSTSGRDLEGVITKTVGSNTVGTNARRIQLSLKLIY